MTRMPRLGILLFASVVTFPLSAAEPVQADAVYMAAAQQDVTAQDRLPDSREVPKLLPPPPPGPYQSRAFEREFERQSQSFGDRVRAPYPGPRDQSSRQVMRTPERPSPAVPETRYPVDRAMNDQRMNMFSPDRPWPEDLRPMPPRYPVYDMPVQRDPQQPVSGFTGNYPSSGYRAPAPQGYRSQPDRYADDAGMMPERYGAPGMPYGATNRGQ